MVHQHEIKTDLDRMYQAGKDLMPSAGEKLGAISNSLYGHLRTFDAQAALAGDPAILRSMLEIGNGMYDVLRQGVVSINHAAEAVLMTADDFRRHDEDARDAMRGMESKLRDESPQPLGKVPPWLRRLDAPGSSDGVTPSTADPDAPSQDAKQRKENEEGSRSGHERQKHRG